MKTILIVLVILLILWTLWSIYISRAEQMTYTVLEKRSGYEIRKYDPYIAATVTVNKNGREGLNDDFRILAGYIFGGNESQKSIAMTTPVLTQEKTSESIAMTTPVMTQEKNNETSMTFSMPKKYSLDTLPKALDSRIIFTEVPSKKFAAYRFSWYYSENRIRTKKARILEMLKKDTISTVWEPIFAGYNGPGTIPFLMRNEIMVEIAE